MPLSDIPQHTIGTEFRFQSGVSWDKGQMHCGICEIGQFCALTIVESFYNIVPYTKSYSGSASIFVQNELDNDETRLHALM